MKIVPFFAVLMLLQALSFMGKACIHTQHPLPGVTPQTGLYTHQMPLVNETLLRRFVDEQLGEQTETNPCNRLACADVVAAYLYLGEYEPATLHSTALLKAHPNDYGVLMNHAFVLEMRGKYKEALKYLKQAIAIDPEAHLGSEWIHQLLLEKRITGKTKPKSSVLKLDFGNEVTPVMPDELLENSALRDQVAYVIDKQLYFTQKPDPLFASLLFDYANMVSGYGLNTYENYFLADEYGCTDTLLYKRMEKAFDDKQHMESFNQQMDAMGSMPVTQKPTTLLYLKILAALIPLLGFVVHFLRKKTE